MNKNIEIAVCILVGEVARMLEQAKAEFAEQCERRFFAQLDEPTNVCKRHSYPETPCYDCQQEKELRTLHNQRENYRANQLKRKAYLKRCLPQQNGTR